MNLTEDRIRPIYFRYLLAAFGSAFITSIYGIVDASVVGQYQGPLGSAALAVFAPIWNIIYSLGLLTGIGSSVLFSSLRGQKKDKEANSFYTSGFLLTIILSFVAWMVILFFDRELLTFFGADETTLPLALKYMLPIKCVVPCFLFNQFFAAFLRADKDPGLATVSVIFGGVFNIAGDYLLVFTFDLGIMGAGIATILGSFFSLLLMLTHFFRKRNTLHFTKPIQVFRQFLKISVTGFSSFFVDVAMGILTILFNRQILRYFSNDQLSVYGILINISTLVQCCAYSIGQASQPLISENFGAKKTKRVKEVLFYSCITAFAFGILWIGLCEGLPNFFVRIFMTPTETIYSVAPSIIRIYSISFLLLPFNIFSTYYFQSVMKPGTALLISVIRGLALSGLLIYVLPLLFTGDGLWWTMPITESVVFILSFSLMLVSIKKEKKVSEEQG